MPGADTWASPLFARRCMLAASSWGLASKPFFLVAAGIAFQLFEGERIKLLQPVGGISEVNASYGAATILVWSFLAVLLATVGLFIQSKEQRVVQRERDRKAARILTAILEENSSRFFLYLRPFFLTAHVPLKNPRRSEIPMVLSYHSEPRTIDFETLLERSVRRFAPLVAIGRQGVVIGAGRITLADTEWKARLEVLAQSAELIFVIPSQTSGTKWEVARLKEMGLISKCIFVMPPKPNPGRPQVLSLWPLKLRQVTLDTPNLWQQAADALREMGLNPPPYSDGGLLFMFDASGVISTAKTFKLSNFANAIADLRNGLLAPSGRPS
jgi:hypothetical protein